MTKRMLIDATHAEETRVVVLDGSRLEDFDVETSTKRQLKGNIYLAKVVRVEPSLQAAFVEYGGNRHGFLAFGEIHPDYYQIPVADRQRLLAMEAEDARREAEEEDRAALSSHAGAKPLRRSTPTSPRDETGSRAVRRGRDRRARRAGDRRGRDRRAEGRGEPSSRKAAELVEPKAAGVVDRGRGGRRAEPSSRRPRRPSSRRPWEPSTGGRGPSAASAAAVDSAAALPATRTITSSGCFGRSRRGSTRSRSAARTAGGRTAGPQGDRACRPRRPCQRSRSPRPSRNPSRRRSRACRVRSVGACDRSSELSDRWRQPESRRLREPSDRRGRGCRHRGSDVEDTGPDDDDGGHAGSPEHRRTAMPRRRKTGEHAELRRPKPSAASPSADDSASAARRASCATTRSRR